MKICVFCGGAGTRMWPVSRRSKPKQFQKFLDNKSPFQLMIERLIKGFGINDIYVVTGKEYKEVVRKQIPSLPKSNLILEPSMRDTLGAVGYAASYLEKKFPGEVMASIWGADHVVNKEKEFIRALNLAEELAKKKDVIVKVDVRPTFPSVHLGYVRVGKKIDSISGFDVYEFVNHIEKPKLKKAKSFLESKDYLWNTGYLIWNLSTFMKLLEKHNPLASRILRKIQTITDQKEIEGEFKKIPRVSIDYAFFEKLKKGDQIVIEANLGWADVGAWDVLKDELADSSDQNVTIGSHMGFDTKGSLIYSDTKGKIIATIGIKDMIIVDTKDALLICPRNRSQDIKKIVLELERKKKERYL